ncbi:NAD(P)-dependent dehydrogenase (short-subunit alcohol dehydrogenase family) [Asanoa ferruginea]|uniref:NAD(P)-dependent dehydrogenase (Short-subunit alcohol dehydrogenase family) n=1 Tax=Asanoa ferruginea TaxID=53367 RepID=A0A3D9ZI57_9ACTN|nr:SDR family oxidoreductase [Asanoa ferruginea]REF96204.1 NAD(P)-dependent dehydrogenase (short-subunit alcohol dehydrogenase family) [Asanoa ferruginea]GIF49358.1 short-chain dehydrogenase [Asanoa ferruginea]
MGTSIVVGGTGGLGQAVAAHLAARGDTMVVTSRDKAVAEAAAAALGPGASGLAVDLAQPATIADALASVGEVDHLVITATSQVPNTLADFDLNAAVTAHTIKLVGYAEVVRVLRDRFRPGASVVLFGGVAKDRPYPGSTVVTTHNAGLAGLAKTLATQIAPHRVNVIHPGIVGDSPKWRDMPDHPHVARTPIGRLVTVAEIVDATDFLLRNGGINGQELLVEGGVLAV